MANARFQANGVDVMIDGLLAAGETAGDIRERLWQVAWTRGHQEVVVPFPVPDVKIEGFCVLTQQFSSHRALVCIDDGEQLVGVIDELNTPPLGAKVRLLPLYGTAARWSVKTLATLGCGLQIRFDEARAEPGWIDRLKACLHAIREAEFAVRRQIEVDRRNIAFVLPPAPFRVEMEKADREIRDRVTSAGYTDAETKALARARNNQAEVDRIAAAHRKRLVESYRSEALAFRALIPDLRVKYDAQMEAYAEFRRNIDRCNETDAASRAITDATVRASQKLETIESAVLSIRPDDLARVEANPRRYVGELIQTIDLLFELLPKRLQRPTAVAGA